MDNEINLYDPFQIIKKDFEDILQPLKEFKFAEFRTPLVNIKDNESEFEISIEIPGVKKEEINVDAHKDYIKIEANTKKEKEEKEENYYKYEMRTNSFSRVIKMPEKIKSEEVNGELKDGVLILKAPKLSPIKNDEIKRVQIK
jgi:HSP20 family protein